MSDNVLPPSLVLCRKHADTAALIKQFVENPFEALNSLPALTFEFSTLPEIILASPVSSIAGVLATDFCNLRCNMCMFHSDDDAYDFSVARQLNRPRQTLSYEHFSRYVSQLPKKTSVSFSSAGEYLTHKHAMEHIKHAADLGLRPDLVTNGMLLNESTSRELLDAGVRNYTISAEGYDETSYQQHRRGGVLDTVVSNIAILRNVAEKQNISITVNINAILFPEIIQYKQRVVELWRDKVDRLTFLAERIDYLGTPRQPLAQLPPASFPCFEMLNGPLLLSNGRVTPCCSIAIGEWFESFDWLISIDTMPLSDIIARYADLFLDESSAFAAFCRKCAYKGSSYLYNGESPFFQIYDFSPPTKERIPETSFIKKFLKLLQKNEKTGS